MVVLLFDKGYNKKIDLEFDAWKVDEYKMKKKKKILFVAVFCCSLICGITSCRKENQKEYEKTEEIFNTIITGKVYGEKAKEALEAAFEKAEEIETIMSAEKSDSELSKLNREAYQKEVFVSEELYQVIEKAIYYAKTTDGSFDPTIGKLIDLWGIGTEHARVPSEKEIRPYMDLKDYNNIKLNKEKHSIRFLTDTIRLNLGGIAKGYAADEMKRILVEQYDIQSGILSLGGNVIAIGSKTTGEAWTVGIVNPLDTSAVIQTLQIRDQTVVTSGNYERYFIKNKIRYHHILNPKTGYPAKEGVISSSIIADCSMDADALSTATYVMGIEKGLEFIDNIDGIEAVFVKEDGSVVTTKGLQNEVQ